MGIPCEGEHVLKLKDETLVFKNSTEFKAWLTQGGFERLVKEGYYELPTVEEATKGAKVEAPEDQLKTTGISKEIITPEMVERGLSDADKLFISSSDPVAWETAKAIVEENPNAPEELINSYIYGGKRSVAPSDPLVLLYEKVRLEKEQGAINKRLDKALSDGNTFNEFNERVALENLRLKQKNLLQVIDFVGSQSGKTLRHMGFLADSEMSFAGLTKAFEREYGRKLSSEESKRLQEIADKYAKLKEEYEIAMQEADQRIQEAKDKAAEEAIAKVRAEIESEGKVEGKVTKKVKKIADAVRSFKNDSFELKDENGNPIDITTMGFTWNDLVEGIAKAIEKAGELTDKVIDEYLSNYKWYKNLTNEGKNAVVKQLTEKLTTKEVEAKSPQELDMQFNSLVQDLIEKSEGDWHEGLYSITQKMLKNRVEKNLDVKIDQVVSDIYNSIKDDVKVSKEQIKADISGYGKWEKLTEDKIKLAMMEIREQGRLDLKLKATEEGELPLRNGKERREKSIEALDKIAKIAKNIKEKNLVPPATEKDMEAVYRSREAALNRALDLEIERLNKEIDTGIKREKGQSVKISTPEIENKRKTIERLRKLRNERLGGDIQKRVEAKTKALNRAITEIQKDIETLRSGEEVEKPVTVTTKDGKKIFKFGKPKKQSVTNDLIESLENEKAALEAELDQIMPENLKNQALFEKQMKNRERRLEYLEQLLEKGKTDKSVFEKKPKTQPFENKEIADINKKIRKLEADVWYEKQKAEEENRGKFANFVDKATELQRFMIFLNPWGIGRLAYAAMFRPATKPATEIAKLVLSNLPGTSGIMKKSVVSYRPTIGSMGRSLKNYYTNLFSGKTFKDALSEYKSRSNFSLQYEPKTMGRGESMYSKILAKPEQTHAFLKAFPKIAELESSYKSALENLSNEINPDTNTFYDITDPRVQQLAMEMAMTEAKTAVFMQDAIMSKATNQFIETLAADKDIFKNALGLYLKQQMPILKVPPNFYHEIIQQLPGGGLLDAAQMILRSGESKEARRGVKNLTQKQAQETARALINQFVGLTVVGVGIALYNKFGDDIIKEFEEHEYWFHNTAAPLIKTGFEIGKDQKEKPDEKTKSVMLQSLYTGTREGLKLPQVRGAAEFGYTSSALAKSIKSKMEGKEKEAAKEMDALSMKGKKMAAAIMIPSGLAEWAKRRDENRKRDPQTFEEILKVRLPWTIDEVPLKSKKKKGHGPGSFRARRHHTR